MAVPNAVLARARDTAHTLGALAGIDVDAEELLGGRAVLLGLESHGRVSAGGATRLMTDGGDWCALTLSRPDDIDAVPALIESDAVPADPWPMITRRVHTIGASAFAERARLLGLPAGVLGETGTAAAVLRHLGGRAAPRPLSDLLVADLSSMWAGPLCGQLLVHAGATVVKVESAARPDGTRTAPAQFFDWINGGKLSYQADFTAPDGLRRLLTAADVVIESSRPTALARRGLGPTDVPTGSGRIWLRITGHGAEGPRADWVAFGDDAAVSGGLVAGSSDAPVFCGDAIADPLTGIQAALALMESRARGGGEIVEIAMSAVAAAYAQLDLRYQKACTTAPSPTVRASALGSDNVLVDRLVARRLVASC